MTRPVDIGIFQSAQCIPGKYSMTRSIGDVTGARRRFVLGMTLVMAGGSCATSSPFDTTHAEAEPGLFYISTTGSSFAADDDVMAAWHQRARSLCPDGYDRLVDRSYPRDTDAPTSDLAEPQAGKRYLGYARCKHPE